LVDKDTKKRIEWYWASDSGAKGKTQDIWVRFIDKDLLTKLETAYRKHKKKPSDKKYQHINSIPNDLSNSKI